MNTINLHDVEGWTLDDVVKHELQDGGTFHSRDIIIKTKGVEFRITMYGHWENLLLLPPGQTDAAISGKELCVCGYCEQVALPAKGGECENCHRETTFYAN